MSAAERSELKGLVAKMEPGAFAGSAARHANPVRQEALTRAPRVHEVFTLTDGGQPAEAVAERVVAFLAGRAAARSTSRSTTSGCPARSATGSADAIRAAHARGVRVRIVFNQDERPRG